MASVGFREPEKAVKASINFATPAASVEEEEDYDDDDLDVRIEDFKFHNPDEVDELKKCIQDVLVEAERIAQERLDQKAVIMSFHILFQLISFIFIPCST
jgi:hypothetical protein